MRLDVKCVPHPSGTTIDHAGGERGNASRDVASPPCFAFSQARTFAASSVWWPRWQLRFGTLGRKPLPFRFSITTSPRSLASALADTRQHAWRNRGNDDDGICFMDACLTQRFVVPVGTQELGAQVQATVRHTCASMSRRGSGSLPNADAYNRWEHFVLQFELASESPEREHCRSIAAVVDPHCRAIFCTDVQFILKSLGTIIFSDVQ